MADIWLVKEGSDPTSGDAFQKASLRECIDRLNLNPKDYLCGPDTTPRFGMNQPDRVRGPRYVVVEVANDEVRGTGMKPGFYLARLSVADARRRLTC